MIQCPKCRKYFEKLKNYNECGHQHDKEVVPPRDEQPEDYTMLFQRLAKVNLDLKKRPDDIKLLVARMNLELAIGHKDLARTSADDILKHRDANDAAKNEAKQVLTVTGGRRK